MLVLLLVPIIATVVLSSVLWEAFDRGFSGPPLSGLLVSKVTPFLNRCLFPWAKQFVIHDNDAFAVTAAIAYGVGVPILFLLCAASAPSSIFVAFVYNVIRIGPYFMNFAYVYTLCHKEGHKHPLWKDPSWRGVFNKWIGLFYGIVPENFAIGHSYIHHKYNNGPEDVTTTRDTNRDSAYNFWRYLWRMMLYCSNISVIYSLVRKKRFDLAATAFLGCVQYTLVLIAASLAVHPKFMVMYLLYPFFESVVMLAAINWCWHAFIDPDDPDNPHVASLTITSGPINVLNENYHVAHHAQPGRHWAKVQETQYRLEYDPRHATGSTFKNTHVFELFVLILCKDYEGLAARHAGGCSPSTLRKRLRFVPPTV